MSRTLTNYDLVEIVDKINGDIIPRGETHHDIKAFESLKQIESLVEYYINEIIEVAEISGLEASIDIAREEARDFLKDIYEQLKDVDVI